MGIVGPEATSFLPISLAESTLFDDRVHAGNRLARALPADLESPVVVGVTHGGVEIASEVAAVLRAPLDAAMVVKICHPTEPSRVIGAAAPGDAVHVSERTGMSDAQLVIATARARREAATTHARLHARHAPLELAGRDLVLVDEAVTTGATMLSALVWGRGQKPRRIVTAIPVGASAGLELVRAHTDLLVCLYAFEYLGSRGIWFGDFPRLGDDDVLRLLEGAR